MKSEYDVIVVGGGTAGVVAAVQASRAGSQTLLVEKTGMLGGTITSAGVSFPGLFHAWGRQIIAGIGWELVSRCVTECGGHLPDFSTPPTHHSRHQIPINRAVYAALCDEVAVNSGADILLHTMLSAVEPYDDGWKVSLCAKNGLVHTAAKVLVDCTGDANAVSFAGGALRVPEETQPATLAYRVTGYNPASLDVNDLNSRFARAVQDGLLSYTDAGWDTTSADIGWWLARHGTGANHIHGFNACDSEDRTRLELEARHSMLRLFRFLKQQPGLGSLEIDSISAECGVRETATIVGEETITVEDYVSGRVWHDAVCYSFYPVDLHMSSGRGLDCRPLPEGAVPTVPRGALLPKELPNLVVAGRCISSDRLANSALRVQATCMATGQAAGALASLSAKSGMDVRSVSMPELRELLESHDAIVPPPS